jgi:sugar-phosphatase
MKAAIFDMDGLLIDSEPLWRRAEREVFRGVGLKLTDDDCRRTTGLRADEVVAYWFERRPWRTTAPAVVLRDLEARVIDLIRLDGQVMQGARRVIDLVRAEGLRLALASSSTQEIIQVVLASLELDGVFEILCSAADEERGKPDPAVYHSTLHALGLPAAECAAFEDSAAGVEAAGAAGVYTIAVPDPGEFDDPRFDRADLKLESLERFDLAMIGLSR